MNNNQSEIDALEKAIEVLQSKLEKLRAESIQADDIPDPTDGSGDPVTPPTGPKG